MSNRNIEISIFFNNETPTQTKESRQTPDNPPVVIKVRETEASSHVAKRRLDFTKESTVTGISKKSSLKRKVGTSSGRFLVEAPSSSSSPGPSSATDQTPEEAAPKRRVKAISKKTPLQRKVKKTPKHASAEKYLNGVKQILLDPKQSLQPSKLSKPPDSPVLRKKKAGAKKLLSSDEDDSDHEVLPQSSSLQKTTALTSQSFEGTSEEKDEEPAQESWRTKDGGEAPEVDPAVRTVSVDSETQTDEYQVPNDELWQSADLPGVFTGIQFCIFGPRKGELESRVTECGGIVVDDPVMFNTEMNRLFITSNSVCESRLQLSSDSMYTFRRLYREYGVITLSRDWILESIARKVLQPLVNYLVNDNRGCQFPDI